MPWRTSQPKLEHEKKNPSPKNSLIFLEMELYSCNIQNIFRPRQKNAFFIPLEKKAFITPTQKKCNPALCSSSSKNKKIHPKKNVSYFRKRKAQKNWLYLSLITNMQRSPHLSSKNKDIFSHASIRNRRV